MEPEENQTSQSDQLVSIDWIDFRSDGDRADYGDARFSTGVAPNELLEAKRMLRACHSDTEQPPYEHQAYFWKIRSTSRWALMRSEPNAALEEQGLRPGRIYVVLLFSDVDLVKMVHGGNPVSLLGSRPHEDLFERAKRRACEIKMNGEGQMERGSALNMGSNGSAAERSPRKPVPVRRTVFGEENLSQRVGEEIREAFEPPTFATWWSHLRPVPDDEPFEFMAITPARIQALDRQQVATISDECARDLRTIRLPDSVSIQELQEWSEALKIADEFKADVESISMRAASDRTVWEVEWPRLTQRMRVAQRRLDTITDWLGDRVSREDARALHNVSDRIGTLVAGMKGTRPPALRSSASTVPQPDRKAKQKVNGLRPILAGILERLSASRHGRHIKDKHDLTARGKAIGSRTISDHRATVGPNGQDSLPSDGPGIDTRIERTRNVAAQPANPDPLAYSPDRGLSSQSRSRRQGWKIPNWKVGVFVALILGSVAISAVLVWRREGKTVGWLGLIAPSAYPTRKQLETKGIPTGGKVPKTGMDDKGGKPR